jgi:2-polyprenyl-6-methoxyphenol hydroxylase-like FAD-dependent oxidoreductase
VPPGETIEQWAPGSFLGTYPTRDRLCVIAGAPVKELEGDGHQTLRARLAGLSAFRGWDADALTADLVVDGPEPVLWRMADVRSPTWVRGRVALVGDAAAAFMPTAGIGASMALESAAALADELSRADAAHVPHALALFERRRRRRVEVAQTQSRRLARLMFVRSPALSIARDRIAGRASMEQVVAPLIRSLAEPL